MNNANVINEALKEFNTDKYNFSVSAVNDILFFRWDVTRFRDYKFNSYAFSRLKKYYYVVIFFDNGTYIARDVLVDKHQKNYKKAVLSKLANDIEDSRLRDSDVMADIEVLRKPVNTFLRKCGYKDATKLKRNKTEKDEFRMRSALPEEVGFSDKIVKLPIWFFGTFCTLMILLGVLFFIKIS